MPLREQLAELGHTSLIPLFPGEQEALDAFNLLYAQGLAQHQQQVAQKFQQWQQQNPTITLSSSTFFKNYHQIHLKRGQFSADYNDLDDRSKTPLLAINLPNSLKALSPYRMVALALSKDGEQWFHYLDQFLNNAVKIHAQQNTLGLAQQSSTGFYRFLNNLDNYDLTQRLDNTAAPELYKKFARAIVNWNLPENAMLHMEGNILQLLGSVRVYAAARKAYFKEDILPSAALDAEKAIIERSAQQALYDLAAKLGCHDAAIAVTNRANEKILASKDLASLESSYNYYCTQYVPAFIEQYKAEGALLHISVQKRYQRILNNLLKQDPSLESVIRPKLVAVSVSVYHQLRLAEHYEQHDKSTVRLYFNNADNCDKHITDSFEADSKVAGEAITSINDALYQLMAHRTYLQAEFQQIDRALEQTKQIPPMTPKSAIACPDAASNRRRNFF